MRELNTKEIQEVELNIFKWFDAFCKENDLTYNLCGGTLLGAIRHKGFIPWDDDIDLYVDRINYNKLLEIAKKQDTYGHIKIELGAQDTNYYPFIKIVDLNTTIEEKDFNKKYEAKIWIDIFTLDYLPENKWLIKKHFFMGQFYMTLLFISSFSNLNDYFARTNSSLFKRIVFRIFYPFAKAGGYKKWAHKMQGLAHYKKSKNIGNAVWPNGNDIFDIEWFHGTIKGEFEGMEVPIIKGYKEYLERAYGDYMQLPPKSQQVGHLKGAFLIEKGDEGYIDSSC